VTASRWPAAILCFALLGIALLGIAPLGIALLGIACGSALAAERVTVFAAASLTDALETAGARWREQGPGEDRPGEDRPGEDRPGEDRPGEERDEVRFSFAASSTLARQIEAGAPGEIYASANVEWMDDLERAGLIEPGTRVTPIGNRLALIAPKDGTPGELAIDAGLDLAGLLGPEGFLAVGDPGHVPAGIYAEQALRALGLWESIEGRLARADDVRAALALVDRGEAPLGIVFATDAALTDRVAVVGLFPEASHAPIAYPFAIVADAARPEVRALFDFLTGEEALGIYERFGFMRIGRR